MLEKNFKVDLVLIGLLSNKNIQNLKIHFEHNRKKNIINNLFGYIGGMSEERIKQILELIEEEKYEYVYIDGSYFGKLAFKIKKRFNKIKIITFFHNIEYYYSISGMRKNFKRYAYTFFSTWLNEYLSVSYSDLVIVLNERDSRLLKKRYNKESDLLLNVTMKDLYKENDLEEEKFILFVGSNFFGNLSGIKWFVENISEKISIKTYIIGKGMETEKKILENKNVKVLGTVEDISEYYYKAKLIIAPIFYGGGMKVKIAEALMFGKKILGTKEAFEGYIRDSRVLIEVNTAEEFINFLKDELLKKNTYEEKKISRRIFLENYCLEKKAKILTEKILEL